MKFAVRLCLVSLIWLNWDAVIVTSYLIQQSFNSTFRSRSLKAIDWCALKCKKGENIACTLKGDCLTITKPCDFVSLDKIKLVDVHNQLRNLFATGNEPRGEGLEVADMMAVQWDDDLAFTASCNLKECPESMNHDSCHITPLFATSGQNLAWAKGVPDCVKQSGKMVHSWYNEVNQLSSEQLRSWGKAFQHISGTGHFTQVIWSHVTHIGCAAYEKKLEDGRKECMLACNYGPAGNMIGGSMFKEGSPASSCPEGVASNNKYSGLCGGASGKTSYLPAKLGFFCFTFVMFVF